MFNIYWFIKWEVQDFVLFNIPCTLSSHHPRTSAHNHNKLQSNEVSLPGRKAEREKCRDQTERQKDAEYHIDPCYAANPLTAVRATVINYQ